MWICWEVNFELSSIWCQVYDLIFDFPYLAPFPPYMINSCLVRRVERGLSGTQVEWPRFSFFNSKLRTIPGKLGPLGHCSY